jgi:hypothetical protein
MLTMGCVRWRPRAAVLGAKDPDHRLAARNPLQRQRKNGP